MVPRRELYSWHILSISLLLIFQIIPLSGCSKEKVQRKILLFGIDGATWNVMDPLLDKGKLPNLASLIHEGTRARLKTLTPTFSPRIWTTIVTGTTPEVHGIETFVVKVPGSDETALPTSNMRKVKALWNIFSDFDYSVGMVGWWASFPAEEVNGFIISDHANYIRKGIYKNVLNLTERGMTRKEKREIYPSRLYDEVADFVNMNVDASMRLVNRFVEFPSDKLAEFQEQRSFSRSNKLSVLKFSLMNDESFTASGLYALKKYKPDFMAFYINGLDGVEHHFWKYMEPEKFKIPVPEEEILLYRDLIEKYYIYVDEILGRFLSMYRDNNSTIFIVSDHGHEANPLHDIGVMEEKGYAKFASGDHVNAPDGILVMSGKDIKKEARLPHPSVMDITPTLLALMGLPVGEDMPGKVLKSAIAESFLVEHPVQKTSTYSSDRKYSNTPIKSGMEGMLKKKLQALGYIQ